MYSGISKTVVERKPDSILYLNSVGFPVFFLDVDHTEKSCLSVSGTSADPAPAAHKSQGQQGN